MIMWSSIVGSLALVGIAPILVVSPIRSISSDTHSEKSWVYKTDDDNTSAVLKIDAQGTNDGAAPFGYAELVIRAQDEIRDRDSRVRHSSDVQGHIRVMSYSYAYPLNGGDPTVLTCYGTQCGQMMESYVDGTLRSTAGGGGSIDWVTGNKQRMALDKNGVLSYKTVVADDYQPPKGRKLYACIIPNGDGAGQVVAQLEPCQ